MFLSILVNDSLINEQISLVSWGLIRFIICNNKSSSVEFCEFLKIDWKLYLMRLFSEWVIVVSRQMNAFSATSTMTTIMMIMILSALYCLYIDQLVDLDFNSVSSLKQNTQLGMSWCVLSGEGRNTNFTVFGLTQSGIEPKV